MVALEIVIDIDFPVTVDDVVPPLEVFEFGEIAAQLCGILRNIAQYFRESGSVRGEVHEYERSPCFDSITRERHGPAVPVFDPLELGLALKTAIQQVRPTMVRAAQRGAVSFAAGDCARAVPANIAQRAQISGCVTDHHGRLAGDVAGEVVARVGDPVHESDGLPGMPENLLLFESQKNRI